jgi:hypothetical protein
MRPGRPRKVDPGTLYALAHLFYWDFRRLAEGTRRWRFDEKKFLQLTEGLEDIPLVGDEDRLRHQGIVDEEIRTQRLDPSRRKERLQDMADSEVLVRRVSYREEAAEKARKEIKVRGEPDVIKILLDLNTTPEQVRALCGEAFMNRRVEVEPGVVREVEFPAWPIPPGSALPTHLSQYAEQYVAALHDVRFPRCDVSKRPSSRLKQLWFMSRALAGALYGVTSRTAVNLVGSRRPEEIFRESRDGKPARNHQRKRRHKG